METPLGRTIAGYRLEAVLGHGGMSAVYLAEQVRLGRKVALKLLASELAANATFRERFEREARQAAEIDHPNIVPVYDAGEADGHLYIAMRRVDGRDLRSLLATEGPLTVGRTLYLLEQAAAALDAAHARGLVHRDVKPANLLIEDATERVYVSDFGIAKRVAATGMTRTGFFLGTVDYAAPEQIEGGEVDARTDVYALGCVLYECLSGQRPYVRESEVAVMHAHLTEPPPKLTDVSPELLEPLDSVIATAMAKGKEQRYGTSGELMAAARAAAFGTVGIERVSAALPVRARRTVAPWEMLTRRSGRRWLAAAILVLLAGGGAVGIAAMLSGGDEPAATTTAPSAALADGVALAKFIPEGLLPACRPARIYDGASATAACLPEQASTSFFPERVEVSLFTRESIYEAYSLEARAHGFAAPSDVGGCDARRWRGEGPWVHGPSSPGGSRFCYLEGDEAVLVWTHEQHGEPDHESVLGFARVPRTEQDELLAWWSFWRHRIGRVTY